MKYTPTFKNIILHKHKTKNKMKTIQTNLNDFLTESSIYTNYSFAQSFIDIIKSKAEDYDSKAEILDNLKGFLEDLRSGGCMSGIIGEFIYNSDIKAFYIEHLDDLEEFKNELEDISGEPINNRDLPHYTFIVWLCFEEFANDLYNTIFEN